MQFELLDLGQEPKDLGVLGLTKADENCGIGDSQAYRLSHQVLRAKTK